MRRSGSQRSLFDDSPTDNVFLDALLFGNHLEAFEWNGKATMVSETTVEVGEHSAAVRTYVNEFWTSRQRAAHSLHEISYRACFKPQLPRCFIERLTRPGETVYDPFMGRGTTVLEAALMGRVALGCDINPVSKVLVEARLQPPALEAVRRRLSTIDWTAHEECPEDLLTFYHADTLREICALKAYLLRRLHAGQLDRLDEWVRMVAVNRLTGHSPGFFSVYTLPPNQAVSLTAQQKINADRSHQPVGRPRERAAVPVDWCAVAGRSRDQHGPQSGSPPSKRAEIDIGEVTVVACRLRSCDTGRTEQPPGKASTLHGACCSNAGHQIGHGAFSRHISSIS